MPRIVVTPAGRERYLALLYRHLKAQRADFDEWHLWLNTPHGPDIKYCENLAAKHDWIKTRPLTVPFAQNLSIHSFFPECTDPDSVYLRLDDDIVWLQPGFVREIFDFRLKRPEFFLVYANILNNAITSHIYQRNGAVSGAFGIAGYDCLDRVGWASPLFGNLLHSEFAASVRDGTALTRWRCFHLWRLFFYERVSINAISWLGSEFARFGGKVLADEEHWLSCHRPVEIQKINAIYGNALCAHFAFHPQRDQIEFAGDQLLALYSELAPE